MGIVPLNPQPVESAPIVPESAPVEAAAEPRRSDGRAGRVAEAGAEAAQSPAAAEEQMIEVWRPGRFENRERRIAGVPIAATGHRGSTGDPRRSRAAAPPTARSLQAADAATSPAGENAPQRQRHHRRPHQRGERHGSATVPNGATASGRSTTAKASRASKASADAREPSASIRASGASAVERAARSEFAVRQARRAQGAA